MNHLRVEAGVSRYSSVRQQRQAHARVAKRAGFALAFALGIFLAVGFAFAGSSGRIADGVKIDGVDVGGLSATAAEHRLRQAAAENAGRINLPWAFDLPPNTDRRGGFIFCVASIPDFVGDCPSYDAFRCSCRRSFTRA